MSTFDRIEEYLASCEDYFFSSLSAVAHGLPDVHEVADRLWIDISRYGPGLPTFPEVRIPSLGDFQVPPPPPPPPSPAPIRWLEKSTEWITDHPWMTTGIAASIVGTGLFVRYNHPRSRRDQQRLRAQQTKSTDRRQVVVVLGADSPFGLPLILDLEKKGYIVIASVATPEDVEPLERQTQGYVKALVLDPYEPLMLPAFMRSLTATLARKFPINAAGDPFASLATQSYITSVISLLTLPSGRTSTRTLAPLEHVPLNESYLPYLTATHITPLQVIQALLPLLRAGSAITHDKGLKKTVVVCLPATDTRVGLPFAGVRSMSAAATERATEVLRREIRAAAATGKGIEGMKNIKVVVVDVGTFDVAISKESREIQAENVWKAMGGWSASEKLAYGPAYASVLQGTAATSARTLNGHPKSAWQTFVAVFKDTNRTARKPTDVPVFVKNIVSVVSGGRGGCRLCGIEPGRIKNWIRGERFSVGAGAQTYKLASHLPSSLLDVLLNVPHVLVGIRNYLLPSQPFVLPPGDSAAPTRPKSKVISNAASQASSQSVIEPQPESPEHEESGSDHEVESISGDSVADSSWVSLNESRSDVQEDLNGI
ncbi:hypothetical protein AGABI1DRAFT_52867 [Agaricus bisporus var. burnettii JB137-S8]|uniref:Uncharacterized protein n=1 Tax=Agaricus bisporus var. burnettii (strain JB137-S8 / ATCC MYA-4627 / FGSC 10392) TaxID=597362 RepID=K5X457_AGABU|nr:uncharacterized protein AGABI1DRAFT_52867 [Agaricus bisporus var. burnettii JB137-S8]EKM82586.1 hypothetical protein AGABI1DRAFT_52867 [Agaricus bisporus var. burnettii JB137-S8]